MPILHSISSLNEVPKNAKFDNSYWYYFLILEKDFKNTLNYVHLCKENFATFSYEYSKQLVTIASEFEIISKLLCFEINGLEPGNIGEIKKVILERFPRIWHTPVKILQITQFDFKPLESWGLENGKLQWWDVYNNIKHEKHNYFTQANLENVLSALGSLLIFEVYLYKLAYKSNSGIRYGTILLSVPEMAESGFLKKGELPDKF